MLYPVYVHHDEGSAWGGIFPDLPGCFTAADELQDLPRAAQEAVEAYYGFDGEVIPVVPSSPDRWLSHPDYQGGFWMLLEVDLSRICPDAGRLNIGLD